MVLLNRIYTRAGDQGRTRLANGQQVSKSSQRIEALGAVDELNAHLGVARMHVRAPLEAVLARIQNDLFDLGADLASPHEAGRRSDSLRIVGGQIERLEQEIDTLNADLPPLTSFVLPGGGPASVALHVSRTVCRRAERRTLAFIEAEPGPTHAHALRYLNRLSDLLFVAARSAAADAGGDVLWVPGANL